MVFNSNFDIAALTVSSLAWPVASILARWTLTYTGKPAATGATLIVLRRRPNAPDGQPRWEIVQDASF